MKTVLFKNGNLIECDLMQLPYYFSISINNKGEIIFEGQKDTISYNMEVYTKEEAIKDFCRDRLFTLVQRMGIKIYKVIA